MGDKAAGLYLVSAIRATDRLWFATEAETVLESPRQIENLIAFRGSPDLEKIRAESLGIGDRQFPIADLSR